MIFLYEYDLPDAGLVAGSYKSTRFGDHSLNLEPYTLNLPLRWSAMFIPTVQAVILLKHFL